MPAREGAGGRHEPESAPRQHHGRAALQPAEQVAHRVRLAGSWRAVEEQPALEVLPAGSQPAAQARPPR